MELYILTAIPIIIFVVLWLSSLFPKKSFNLKGAHVLVTGGSSGIGKAVAVEVIKRGASVTLLARNLVRLGEAKDEVEKAIQDSKAQSVQVVSVDLSKDYAAVESAVREAEEQLGPVDMLVNSAGISISGRFEDLAASDFKYLMDVNYVGSVYATRAVVPSMKQRSRGRIVFLSSLAGQSGIFGFSAYSASKFALRGLAEALLMEVKPYNICVSLSFPPDTDTPSYAEELQTQPKETRLICETAGVFQPKYVACAIVNDAVRGKFLCSIGLDGWLLNILTAGLAPASSLSECFQQVLCAGICRIASQFYVRQFDRIVQKCKDEREPATNKNE